MQGGRGDETAVNKVNNYNCSKGTRPIIPFFEALKIIR